MPSTWGNKAFHRNPAWRANSATKYIAAIEFTIKDIALMPYVGLPGISRSEL